MLRSMINTATLFVSLFLSIFIFSSSSYGQVFGIDYVLHKDTHYTSLDYYISVGAVPEKVTYLNPASDGSLTFTKKNLCIGAHPGTLYGISPGGTDREAATINNSIFIRTDFTRGGPAKSSGCTSPTPIPFIRYGPELIPAEAVYTCPKITETFYLSASYNCYYMDGNGQHLGQATVQESWVINGPLRMEIGNISIAQTIVRDASETIPLISGKSSSFGATISTEGGKTGSFTVEVLVGGTVVSKTAAIPLDPVKTTYEITPELFSSYVVPELPSPQVSIPYEIRVVGNNIISTPKKFNVDVRHTYAPTIGLISIGGCTLADGNSTPCYPPTSDADISNVQSGSEELISDMLPVADSSVNVVRLEGSLVGTRVGQLSTVETDFAKLMYIKLDRLAYPSSNGVPINRVVAVANKKYFSYQMLGSETTGVTVKERGVGGVGIASIARPVQGTFLHELGHGFGLEDKDYAVGYSWVIPTGYNARLKTVIDANPLTTVSLMTTNYEIDSVPNRWITKDDYSTLINTFSQPLIDPKVVVVAGLLSKDGSIRVVQSGISENGLVAEDQNGDIQVRIVSSNGTILGQNSVNSDLVLMVEYEGVTNQPRELELNSVPIVTSMLYVEGAEKVEFLKNGSLIKSIKIGSVDPVETPTPTPTPSPTPTPTVTPSPTPSPSPSPAPVIKSVKVIVEKIPVKAYKFLPSLTKALFVAEASLIDGLVARKKYKEALLLVKILEAEVKVLIKDSYVISNSELSKAQVLSELSKIRLILAK